jgi:hypothetical protein
MGKTGSIEWGRIKGRKGKMRLVEKSNLTHKRPGPSQRFDSSGTKRRRFKRSAKAIQK